MTTISSINRSTSFNEAILIAKSNGFEKIGIFHQEFFDNKKNTVLDQILYSDTHGIEIVTNSGTYNYTEFKIWPLKK